MQCWIYKNFLMTAKSTTKSNNIITINSIFMRRLLYLNIVKYFDEALSANDYIDKLQQMLPLQLVRYGKKLSDW